MLPHYCTYFALKIQKFFIPIHSTTVKNVGDFVCQVLTLGMIYQATFRSMHCERVNFCFFADGSDYKLDNELLVHFQGL